MLKNNGKDGRVKPNVNIRFELKQCFFKIVFFMKSKQFKHILVNMYFNRVIPGM